MKRVGFWLRSVALIIDLAVVVICWVGGIVILDPKSDQAISIFLVSVFLALSVLDVILAATLGKLILRLYIAKSDGTPADRWTLLLRWSTLQLPAVSFLLYEITLAPGFNYLGGLSALLVFIGCFHAANDSKRAWHDQTSNTAVFRRITRAAPSFEVVSGSSPRVPVE